MKRLPGRALTRSAPATRPQGEKPVWEVDLLNAPNSQSVSSELDRNTSDMEMSFPACLSEITKHGEAFDARNRPDSGLATSFCEEAESDYFGLCGPSRFRLNLTWPLKSEKQPAATSEPGCTPITPRAGPGVGWPGGLGVRRSLL